MALTVATGFVVDDAIVVLENISRHIEEGMPRLQAAIQGAAEVSFAVLSMSISLIAVFIPILLRGGIIGRLFREFAVTLSVAIMVSLVVSLATTPMMCALLLGRPEREHRGRFHRASEQFFDLMQRGYDRSLSWALDHSLLIVLIFAITLCLNFYLYVIAPKGFFPQQDNGRINGNIQADQSISLQLMRQKLQQFIAIIRKDPAVDTVVGFTGGGTGGGQTNGGFIFISLKPLSERKISADQVIRRLRGELAQVPGASLFLQAVQDIRVGGRAANAQYQYTLQADSSDELFAWAPKVLAKLQKIRQMTEVNSDQQNNGRGTDLTIDRDTAARLGITVALIDNTLYDAFGQRQVSTIYNPKDVFVSTAGRSASGTQTTNAVAGTVYGPGAATARTCATPPPASTTSVSPTSATPTTPLLSSPVATSSAPATSATSSTATSSTAVPTPAPTISSTSTISPAVTTRAAAATASTSSAAAAVASDAVRNQALNSIGNTGNSTASTGSAVSTNAEAMYRSVPSPTSGPATSRSRSITRASRSRPRSRSISRPAPPSATRCARSTPR
jgi:multidrug efflux pump